MCPRTTFIRVSSHFFCMCPRTCVVTKPAACFGSRMRAVRYAVRTTTELCCVLLLLVGRPAGSSRLSPQEEQQIDTLAEHLLGEGIHHYIDLLRDRGRDGEVGLEGKQEGAQKAPAAHPSSSAMHVEYAGDLERRQRVLACRRLLLTAKRLRHTSALVEGGGAVRPTDNPATLKELEEVEVRRRHVGQQAALFLAFVAELLGDPHEARSGYKSALVAPVALMPVNSLSNVAKENLAALLRRSKASKASSFTGFTNLLGERFLVFRFWAGLSNRRQELISMIAAARLLKRTLVLPDLVEGKWMENHKTNRPREPVQAFYDLEKLALFVRVIEEKNFYAHVAPLLPALSTELHIRDYAYPGQFGFSGLSYGCISTVDPKLVQQPRSPEQIVAELGGSPGQVLVIDFSYRLLHLGVPGEFEFFNGTAEWTPRHVSVSFQPSLLYQQVLAHLDFSLPIRSAADSVMDYMGLGWRSSVREQASASTGSTYEFLAVHLRRNDMKYWTNRQHAWANTSSVIAQIQSVLLQNKNKVLKRVFLASDTSEEERNQLRSAIASTKVGSEFARLEFVGESGTPAPPGLSEAQIAILDQVICSRAQVFLGNFWSTFSWAIIEERYKQGYTVDSNLFLQAPLSEDDPRVGKRRKLD